MEKRTNETRKESGILMHEKEELIDQSERSVRGRNTRNMQHATYTYTHERIYAMRCDVM